MALRGPSVQHPDLAGRLQRGPGLPEGRLVQHLAIQGGHTPSFGLALLHCLDDPPACSTSSKWGAYTSLAMPIWLGWMAHFPTNPSVRDRTHSRR